VIQKTWFLGFVLIGAWSYFAPVSLRLPKLLASTKIMLEYAACKKHISASMTSRR
jgi:hypothetical protein